MVFAMAVVSALLLFTFGWAHLSSADRSLEQQQPPDALAAEPIEAESAPPVTTDDASRPPLAATPKKQRRYAYDVIIVGAGQAGLAAAHRLALGPAPPPPSPSSPPRRRRRRLSVLVLEASDHVGGRTRNYDLGADRYDVASDDSYELGGTWLSPDHTAALGLCREVGLGVFNASSLGDGDDCDDGTGCAAAAAGVKDGAPDPGDDSEEEWPWWYYGPDYAQDEMRRQQRIVLHTTASGGDDGHGSAGGGRPPSRKTTFRTASELLEALGGRTLAELERAGRAVHSDASLALPGRGNCWEGPEVGPDWAALDARSTGDVFLTPGAGSGGSSDSGGVAPILSTPDARNILRTSVHNKNAQEPAEVSYLYNLISFKGCNSGPGPDTQYRVVGGTQAIPLKIAQMLAEGDEDDGGDGDGDGGNNSNKVLLNSPVESVRVVDRLTGKVVQQLNGANDNGRSRADQGTSIEVRTESDETYVGSALIVTGAPPAAGRIGFDPPLPPADAELLEGGRRMPMGRSTKFAAVYRSGQWWRRHGLQGDVLASGLPRELSVPIYPPPTTTTSGAEERYPVFAYCFDLSPYSKRFGVLSCFVEGVAHDYLSSLSRERREGLMREFLRLSFEDLVEEGEEGGKPIWEPDAYVLGDWGPDSPYIGGAYTSYFPPRILSEPKYWDAYHRMEKLPNVFLAGSDYHAGFGNGYIEGAVRSGQHAADLVQGRIAVTRTSTT